MQEVQTLSEAMQRLFQKGYTDDFRAGAGRLVATVAKRSFLPSELSVDEVIRFEGETDLDEEMIIFVLSHTSSDIKGTYVVAFGPKMDLIDVGIVDQLKI